MGRNSREGGMPKLSLILVLAGVIVSVLSGAEATVENRTRFSLGIGGLAVTPDTGDARGLIGPAAGAQFNLGRSLFVAPELAVGLGGVYGGATFNVRFNKIFLGVGGGFLYFFSERQEVQGDGMLKVQLGTQGADWYFAAAYVSNVFSGAWLNGVQVTVGHLF